jgi:hypothetical protein
LLLSWSVTGTAMVCSLVNVAVMTVPTCPTPGIHR